MRFGVALPNVSALATGEALLAVCRAAEDLGYTSIWTSDHLLIPPTELGRLDCLEALSTLAFLAARTEHVQLGTSVLITPLREPVLLAKQIATIQQLSGGRLVLGLGVGWLESEFDLVGVDFGRRGELTDSIMDTLDQLLTPSPDADVGGRHVTALVDAFSPRITTPVPILVGGSSVPALRRAARRAAGWHAVWLEPEEIAAATATIHAHHPRPDFEISLRIDLDPTPNGDPVGLCGAPGTIADKVRAYDHAGVQHLIIDFMNRDDHHIPPLTRVLDQLHWFADLVADNGLAEA